MHRLRDLLAVGLIAAILVPMCLMAAGPAWMNADTPLLAVMSEQRLTLFFWGANRFLNIIPAVASPIHNPLFNLLLQIFLFGGSFIGLLALIGRTIARLGFGRTEPLDQWVCFSILLALFVAISSPYALHVFISEGQPYGPSGLLTGLGLALILRPASSLHPGSLHPGRLVRGWRTPLELVVATVALLIGGGLNPSLLLVCGAICLYAFLAFPALRARAVLALLLSSSANGLWLLIGAETAGSSDYGQFAQNAVESNILAALAFLRLAFAAPTALAVLVVAVLLCLPAARSLGVTFQNRRRRLVLAACCVLFAAAWIGLFSQNAWVLKNGSHFRYFYPAILVASGVLALPFASAILSWQPRNRRIAVLLLLVACPLMLVAPWRRLHEFPVFQAVSQAVATADADRIQLVAGSYWQVWPAVFLLLRHHDLAYGIDNERGDVMKPDIVALIRRTLSEQGHVSSLCVDASRSDCIAQLDTLVALPWHATTTACGARCQVIESRVGLTPPDGVIRLQGADSNDAGYIGEGWGTTEPIGRWTLGNSADLSLLLPPALANHALSVQIDATPYAPGRLGPSPFSLLADGTEIAHWTPAAGQVHFVATIPAQLASSHRVLELTLAVARPLTPRQGDGTADDRALGLLVHQVTITPVDR